MDQGLDETLDSEPTDLLWTLGGLFPPATVVIIQTSAHLHQLMLMDVEVVAGTAQVIVLNRDRSR